MRLPNVGEQYEAQNERQRNLTIELADVQNFKRDQDIEVGAAGYTYLSGCSDRR